MPKPLPQHATLGASGAHRWRLCAGSVRMEEGQPDTVGAPAEIGTAAHEIAAHIITGKIEREALADITEYQAEGQKKAWPIDDVMKEYILFYVDYVNDLAAELGVEPMVEVRFSLEPLKPPAPMYGTADVVFDDVPKDHMHVVDFKSGFRAVNAEENDQEMYYALGAALKLERAPAEITLHIVQPSRVPASNTWTMTWEQLVQFKKDIFVDAEATQDPDAPLVPGEKQCQWCSARAMCPALRQHVLSTAGDEFAAAPLVEVKDRDTWFLPTVDELSHEDLLEALEKGAIVKQWLTDLQDHLDKRVLGGEQIDGFKIVQKSTQRKWTSDAETETWFRKKGVRVGTFTTRKLISPAQAEKILKKAKLPESLVSKPEGSYIVLRDSDKRRAITRGEEFTALPVPGGEQEEVK